MYVIQILHFAPDSGSICDMCTARSRYTWDESAIADPGPATVTWGSGSSAGQAHLRWNWVEFSILTPECKRPYFAADIVADDALVFLSSTNPESFDPSQPSEWHNLAFPTSDAHLENAALDPDTGGIIFDSTVDASIDLDALGFTYSANFAVEMILKPGETQVRYAGLFGDHDCTTGFVGMVCQQNWTPEFTAALAAGTANPNSYQFAWGTGPGGWMDPVSADGQQVDFVLDPTIWNHVVISADHHAKPPVINIWVQGVLTGVVPYPEPAVQCPPGTTLEVGDGWATNDSRRWNGEYKRFALYTEPKSADDVAEMFAAFNSGGGTGGAGGGGH